MTTYNNSYPSVDYLRAQAARRIPRFAFEYLDGGCNEEVNLVANTRDIRDVQLVPNYLGEYASSTLTTNLFGQQYSAPFGVAPIGLQGLVWPKAPEILARSCRQHNIPFILSTVSTSSIETIGEITEGNAWFQLYYPQDKAVRTDILSRVSRAGYPVLVLICDTPVFGLRYKDIRNGLSMPARMTVRNYWQIACRPSWALHTLFAGQPQFATLTPYLPKSLNLKQLGQFMNSTFSGRLNKERIARIRDVWKGRLVLKGIASKADAQIAVQLGCDGIIVSNHGGRQLDAGQSAIDALSEIHKAYGRKITVMMDSGIRSGPDIARVLASKAQFVFLGRAPMYSVAALGKDGGEHIINMLKSQLMQVMQQVGCERISELHKHLYSTRLTQDNR